MSRGTDKQALREGAFKGNSAQKNGQVTFYPQQQVQSVGGNYDDELHHADIAAPSNIQSTG